METKEDNISGVRIFISIAYLAFSLGKVETLAVALLVELHMLILRHVEGYSGLDRGVGWGGRRGWKGLGRG